MKVQKKHKSHLSLFVLFYGICFPNSIRKVVKETREGVICSGIKIVHLQIISMFTRTLVYPLIYTLYMAAFCHKAELSSYIKILYLKSLELLCGPLWKKFAVPRVDDEGIYDS